MSEVNNKRGSQRGKWPGKVQVALPPTPSLPIVAFTESAQMGGKQETSPTVCPTHSWPGSREDEVCDHSSDTPRYSIPNTQRFQSGPCNKEHGSRILVSQSIIYWMTLVRYLMSPGFNFLYEKYGVEFDLRLHIKMPIETKQVMKTLKQAELRQQEAVKTTENMSCLARAFPVSPNVSIFHKKSEFGTLYQIS